MSGDLGIGWAALVPSTVEDPVGNAPNERWRGEEPLELER